MNVPSFDPNEEYQFVNNQLYESYKTPPPPVYPTMGGFYKDYETWYDFPYQIMQTYTPGELKVLNGLAARFAVCDNYFSSVPTQTNCNRAFAATGNSLGLDQNGVLTAWVNNHFGPFWDPKALVVKFNQRTIWNVFNDAGFKSPDDWMIYYSEKWNKYCFTRDMFTQIQSSEFDNHFDHIDTFFEKAKAGTLPYFSFLEPAWGLKKWHIGVNGNDYHPPCNLSPGEQFLNSVYKALLTNQDTWNGTLFIINFDEHGGTYDHIKPPCVNTLPWEPPYGTPAPENWENPEDPNGNKVGIFNFNRFGVRVPFILVSPYVEPSSIFREKKNELPYDHCSVIATILKMRGIDVTNCKLGGRVAKASTFESVLKGNASNTDLPSFTPAEDKTRPEDNDPPYNDLQLGIANGIVRHHTADRNLDSNFLKALHQKHFENVETISELSKGLIATLEEVS